MPTRGVIGLCSSTFDWTAPRDWPPAATTEQTRPDTFTNALKDAEEIEYALAFI